MARPKKHTGVLTNAEREQFTRITKNYRFSQRERNRAHVLLLAHQGHTDTAIAEQVGCHAMTAYKVRQRFCYPQETGRETTSNAPTPREHVKRAEQKCRAPRVFDGEKEAKLIAIACSTPPEGAKQWTLELLRERVIALQIVEHVGKETIRQTLKKMNLSLGRKSAGAFLPEKMLPMRKESPIGSILVRIHQTSFVGFGYLGPEVPELVPFTVADHEGK